MSGYPFEREHYRIEYPPAARAAEGERRKCYLRERHRGSTW